MTLVNRILSAAFIAIALGGGAGGALAQQEGLQWAAGSQVSVNAEAALAASQVMRQAGFSVYAVNSAGIIDSLVALGSGDADLANADVQTLRQVWNGTGGFQQVRGFSQVISGFPTMFFILVADNSSIETLADLEGKTINGHVPGAVINIWNKDFVNSLEEAGVVKAGSVKLSQQSINDAVDALNDGRLDAQIGYTFAGGLPSWLQQALARGLKFRILPVSDEVEKNIVAKGWQDSQEDVSDKVAKIDPSIARSGGFKASGGTTVVVARDDLPAETIHGFLKTFFDNADGIAKSHPVNHVYEAGPAYGIQYLATEIPVHPGAERYYTEEGVWRDELTSGKAE